MGPCFVFGGISTFVVSGSVLYLEFFFPPADDFSSLFAFSHVSHAAKIKPHAFIFFLIRCKLGQSLDSTQSEAEPAALPGDHGGMYDNVCITVVTLR